MTSSTREICFAWMMGTIFRSALTGVIIFTFMQGACQCGQSLRLRSVYSGVGDLAANPANHHEAGRWRVVGIPTSNLQAFLAGCCLRDEECDQDQVTLSVLPVRSAQSGGSFSPRVSTQAVAIPQASNAATISRNIDMRLSPSDLKPTMVSYRL
jgi:hypothetical protein